MKNKLLIVLSIVVVLCLSLAACTITSIYDIKFVNDDGTEIATVKVDEGGEVAYNGQTPTKASTAEYDYVFAGWSDADGIALDKLPNATANATYKARYTSTKRSYEVKFVNGETTLQTSTLQYGAAIAYNVETPVKQATPSSTYAFVGWSLSEGGETVDITAATVTGNVTYYAVFSGTAVKYTVTWVVGETTSATEHEYEAAPVYDGTPTKAATDIARYEFAGWAKTADGDVVNLGEEKVVANTTYYAVFTEIRTHFAVKFVNGETELQNELVAKDAAPVYNGTTPVKASDESFDYSFVGWSKTDDDTIVDLTSESITADGIVYHAVFTATPRTATITWHVRGEQTTSTLNYGETLTYGGTLSTADYEDDDYNYTFSGWSLSKNGDVVSLDEVEFAATIDLYAVFNATIKQVKLTIKYIVDGSDEAIADKVLTLDKYTIYGKDTVAADGTTTLTADKSGYLADKPWVAGRLTADETVTVTYRVADVWDGTVATDYASGTGTAEDPYIIETGAQLAYMSSQYRGADSKTYASGVYFKLAANIDLSGHEWTPIAHRSNYANGKWSYFAGNFDGDNHIVKIVINNSSYVGYGLFEGVKGTVSNLTITGSMSVENRCGGIAYMLSTDAIIENCVNYASITIGGTKEGYAGGMVGAANAAASIVNCTNYGDISSANRYAGGIIGSTKTTTIIGCTNYGEVLYTGSGNSAHKGFGGIAGWVTTNSKIIDCDNYGHVNGYSNVGGVAGYLGAGSTLDDACQNFGKVEGHDSTNDIIGANANK